jgi:hypothetical protein
MSFLQSEKNVRAQNKISYSVQPAGTERLLPLGAPGNLAAFAFPLLSFRTLMSLCSCPLE